MGGAAARGAAGPAGVEGPPGGALGLDLLLADLLADGLLVGVDVLVEADALLGDGALLDDRLLGVERDLVLLLGDGRAVERLVDVRVGDRLALDADLLALDRHAVGHVLGRDVLAQAGAAGLAALRPDGELLLGARHRVVGRRAGRVAADRAGRVAVAVEVTVAGEVARVAAVGRLGAILGVGGPLVVVAAAVVRVQPALLLGRRLAVGADGRSVRALVLRGGDLRVVAGGARILDRPEAHVRAEDAVLHRDPLGLAALPV